MENSGMYLPCFEYTHHYNGYRFGRGRFEETMKIPRKTAIEELDWLSFKYMVFDIPVNIGTYEQRYSHLGSSHAKFVV